MKSQLKRLDPDVRVIIASGYSEHEIERQFAGNGLVGVLQKPYSIAVIKERIQTFFKQQCNPTASDLHNNG